MHENRPTVLITGAAGHLGKAVCSKYANEGYRIIATVRPGEERKGNDIQWYEADLSNAEDCDALLGKLSTSGIYPSAAVFCAGGFAMHGIDSIDIAKIQQMIKLNFETAFHLATGLFRQMKEREEGGSLVFISGKPGIHPEDSTAMVSYGLSKGLVASFAKLLDAAGEGQNIRSFTIVPGTIDTEANRKAMPDANRSSWVSPEALADHIFWLTTRADNNMSSNIFEFYGH